MPDRSNERARPSGDQSARGLEPKFDRPLIILTLEGLATSALSCYGSSWNDTAAIDAIAAGGCVWDRWIATNDQPVELIRQWMEPAGCDWAGPWRAHGAVELITDDDRLVDRQTAFDNSLLVDPIQTDPTHAAAEIDETQFGKLVSAAIQRDQQGPWSVMWLHSRFLSQRWDAPRDLFPIDEEELIDMAPSEEPELLEEPTPSPASCEQPIPLIFDSARPPQVELDDRSHPDLVTTWMRTYGCQVRLIDLLLEVLLQSIQADDPLLVLAGTSGMSLGQNGWVGHAAGPLRSCDLRLPLVVSDHGPIRVPPVTPADSFPEIIQALADESSTLVSPQDWCRQDEELDAAVQTQCRRASRAITTAGWSYVQDLDHSDHLFLKPDDVDDTNDVGRLRSDLIDQMVAQVDR